jgi:hypothetical protein
LASATRPAFMTTLDIDIDPAAGSAVIDEARRRL